MSSNASSSHTPLQHSFAKNAPHSRVAALPLHTKRSAATCQPRIPSYLLVHPGVSAVVLAQQLLARSYADMCIGPGLWPATTPPISSPACKPGHMLTLLGSEDTHGPFQVRGPIPDPQQQLQTAASTWDWHLWQCSKHTALWVQQLHGVYRCTQVSCSTHHTAAYQATHCTTLPHTGAAPPSSSRTVSTYAVKQKRPGGWCGWCCLGSPLCPPVWAPSPPSHRCGTGGPCQLTTWRLGDNKPCRGAAAAGGQQQEGSSSRAVAGGQ
jgi:hypothetical protein